MKKILFILAFLLPSLLANAYDAEIDGIYYNFISENEAEVTYQKIIRKYDGNHYTSDYSGSVVIPESITHNDKTYGVTKIGDYAFMDCSSMTSVTIPKSVKIIGYYAFLRCENLEKVIVPDITTWCGIQFAHNPIESFRSNPLCYAHHIFSDEETEITNLVIPNGVTKICSFAFEGCTGLTSITIPNSVTSIGSFAFQGCTGLTSVTIPNSMTSIDRGTFKKCSGMISVTIPESVTIIDYDAFEMCTNLSKIIVPDIAAWCGIIFVSNPLSLAHHIYSNESTEITDLVIPDGVTKICSSAFGGCTGLTSVTIPNSVTDIGSSAFSGCSGLNSVTIPNSVTDIGSSAFSGCSGLNSVTISESVTSISEHAFAWCTSLKSFTIPNSVTYIGIDAFYECFFTSDSFINNSTLTSSYNWGATLCDEETSEGLLIKDHSVVKCRPWATSVTIPNSVTDIGSDAFNGYSGLTSVTIGSSVTSIGWGAFFECSGLTSIISYAFNPPTLSSNVFYGVQEKLVIYVLPAAIDQYQEAAGWKYFTILSIPGGGLSISISLPEGTNAQDYAQMWLELINTKDDQRMHYVITDRTQYTFPNIAQNSTWNAVLRNERGDVFGQIDNIEVKEEVVSVTFSSLSKPQSVVLSVLTPEGQDVTAQTQVTWNDAQGNYIAQAVSLSGLPIGYQANYSIELSQELAMIYETPHAADYTLKDGDNKITCQLDSIKQMQLSGKVKDAETGLPLSGAIISVSQTLGGKYTKTLTAKTDKDGVFTIEVSNVPTSLTFAATDYITQTVNYDNGLDELIGFVVPDVSLKPIAGATITIDFTYTTVEGETQDWYSDNRNVGFELFNVTKNCAISQFNVQYPQIVLLEEVEDGDVLKLTATSRTNAFMPVESKATIAEQKAEASFAIKELGRIQASFTTTDNASVVGSLYDASGKLVKTYNYSNASLTISNLADGQYTLVSMGSSQLYNTIYDLSQLPQTGLVEGSDYVKNTVEVKSGAISQISIDEVPKLDESKLYYTGNNTSFTVNKPSIVVGNYIALTGHIDFKPDYASNVNNVQMIVDLPESCQFVENSVIVGKSTSSYILDGNRITIPMTNYTDQVLFCVIPTLGGDYAPSAFAQFNLNGKTVTQPIGSANYTAKDLSISVSSPVAKTNIPVSGTAIGTSNIEIYDNGVLIGQTISLANGTWATTCELNEHYNLSTHHIYAKVTTKQGLELKSETVECQYDINSIQVSKVHMLYNSYDLVFDFLNPTASNSGYYSYVPGQPDFTFTVDFTDNDTTKVSNVVVYAKTSNNTWTPMKASYNENKHCWVTSGKFDSSNLPVNVSVDFNVDSEKLGDRNAIDYIVENSKLMIEEHRTERENIIAELEEEPLDNADLINLEELLSQENSFEEITHQLDKIVSKTDIVEDLTYEEIAKLYEESETNFESWQIKALAIVKESLDEVYINPSINYDNDFSFSQQFGEYVKTCKQETFSSIDIIELEENGFNHFSLTDGSKIYYHYTENGIEVVDVTNHLSYLISVDGIKPSRCGVRYNGSAQYVECAKRALEFLNGIKANWSQNNKNQLLSNLTVFGELINALICWYDGYREDLTFLLDKQHKERVSDFLIQIEDQNKIKAATEGSLKGYNEECKILNQEWKELIDSYNEIANDNSLSPEIKKVQLEAISNQIDTKVSRLNILKNNIAKETKILKKIIKNISKLEKQLEAVRNNGKLIKIAIDNCPVKIVRGIKVPSYLRVSGKIAGAFGTVLQIACLILDCYDTYDDLVEWINLIDVIDNKIPCEANPEKALDLQRRIYTSADNHLFTHIGTLYGEATAIGFSAADGVFLSPTWWTEMVISAICEWSKMINLKTSIDARYKYITEIKQLCCNKVDPNDNNDDNNKKGGDHKSNNNDKNFSIDPSGYVYEGVPSNRLQGVTATAYYKEMVEDMYGDQHENIVKWDASEYAQENPLFTDEYGMYRWDVPQGLWQVKFEKEGYETTYSEWLPVPPPQLDVNIAMKQARQPEVKDAHAYEDGVEVEFDKYMLPELLTTENIKVMAPSNSPEGVEIAVEGIIELINEETSYEDENVKFASRVRFVPETPFTAKQVTLVVANSVKSYADIPMQDTYTQTLDIEKEVKEIVVDSLVKVPYQGAGTITIHVLPADAAAGRTLTIKNSSSMILGVETEEVIIDEDGKAEVTLSGELPGTAALTFSVEGTDKTAVTIINVELIKPVATPTASIASGSIVKNGTQIELFCATEGATIFYTLDGSCPCVNSEARKVYDGTPITIEKNTVIKAMAVAPDMEDSKIATFVYIVTNGDLNVDGKVDIADGVVVLNTMAEGKYDDFVDVNHDLTVDIADFVTILNIMAQLSVSHEYVDLGLPSGTLWATCNVGASSPEEYGDYFAWGETTGYNSGKTDFNISTYKYWNDSTETLTKYCMSSSDGTVDNKTELEPEDDAATANWGSRWQMPSKEQCEELINSNNTTTEWTSLNGKYGKKITSKINGKSIFLPTAGAFVDTIINYGESEGGLWSRSLVTNNSNFAYYLYFSPTDIYITKYCFRCVGLSVRPVRVDSVKQ